MKMKNIFLNYIEILKKNHFFLLLAIITSFINATIHVVIFTTLIISIKKGELFSVLLKDFLKEILTFSSPFILVWIISFNATTFPQRLKLIVSIMTFFINSFIILFQSIVGTFVIIFLMIF